MRRSGALRVALAQVDTTVGDLDGNAEKVLAWTKEAAGRDAQVVAFPEMALTGYPPEDLVFRETFRRASVAALHRLARDLRAAGLDELAVVVGYLDDAVGPRNSAALLHGGQVAATYHKHHLPNYGVFDEARYFVPGDQLTVVSLHGVEVALTVCEDLWQDGGPFAVAGRAGVGLVVTINGSPYERDKDGVRLSLARRRAAEAGAPVAYVNMVGAQDELVFDGDSFVIAADGTLLARAPQHEETLLTVDLDLVSEPRPVTGEVLGMTVHRREVAAAPTRPRGPRLDPGVTEPLPHPAEVWGSVVAGVRDYARKNGFRTALVAVSGGIDSAVVATVAADAVGADNLYTVSLPGDYSSEHSRSDAAELADRLGCHFTTVPVSPIVAAYHDTLTLSGTAEENLQARVRGTVLMALSNQSADPDNPAGHLVLATGNKTELAVGYSTLYGDTVGGYAPIKDVPKTLVWELARWRNAEAERRGETPPIPEYSIAKPPSAELRPGQLDTDSLPPYDLLDEILASYVDRDLGMGELLATGHDPQTVLRVIRMVDAAEYKRRQYPPGPKISLKAFGRDRRLPISSRWKETTPPPA